MPELGKYAVWVLSAYGVSLALIVAIVVQTVLRARRVRERLDKAQARRGNG